MTDIKTVKAPFGVVDMGSNGIRFGIVSSLARHLPVAYEERAPIALLDAQGDDRIIPNDVINQVVTSFLRFKQLCQDAHVELDNIHVIATEATRIAVNSKEFLDRIFQATGWTVSLLSKQQEALISASGIVGSFKEVNGLTMDLGGGSVEISYVMTADNKIQVSPHPVSMPYGAAALKRRLLKCESDTEVQALYNELLGEIQKAHDHQGDELPASLMQKDGYHVYMSGGGFRALGYLSMAVYAQETYTPRRTTKRNRMYPIPIINGYSVSGKQLNKMARFYRDQDPRVLMKKLKVFRVSKRRASMIPAACFLVSAILEVFKVKRVFFSEGGVRQGFCYQLLSDEERQKDPFVEGVKAYAAQSEFALTPHEYKAIESVLTHVLPATYLDPTHPLQLHRLMPAAIHLSNLTSHYPKETRAFVAFHMPLAGGPLANVPGVSHRERAILAILLAFRQGGAVPDPIFYAIQGFIGRRGLSVCKYLGRLMEFVFTVSPLRPGIGLIESGLSFDTTMVATKIAEENNNADSSDDDDDDDDDDDEFRDNDVEDENASDYPSMQLRITLPETSSPLIDAPGVYSVIESLDKKVNTKKFDMDAERKPLNCPSLFSVEVLK